MKILLDENLDWRLGHELPGHIIESVPLLGWAGIENGALLERAVQNGYEVFITMDSNLSFQQDLCKYNLAVLGLRAPSNRLADTRPLMPKVVAILPSAPRGKLTVIS